MNLAASRSLIRIASLSALLLFAALSAGPSGLAEEADHDFFEAKIRPLLSDNCFACHGAASQMAGLNLSTAETFLKGGASGPVVVKGEPESSRLIDVVRYQGSIKMPPSGKLKDQEIAELTAWVKMGAPWPASQTTPAVAPAPKPVQYSFSKEQKEFWAFSPVKDYRPPAVRNQAWCQSPVDRFILAELEKKGLTPAKPADKLTLLRRVTFDLIGLPPTVNEINDFLKDDLPGAFARVVDRLLNSPRYGERWGRHWLDVARYADSAGADEDIRYPYAYRYRDYVIEALNLDLPYDQFVRQQLAGDLLPAGKPGEMNTTGIVATGFLQVGPKLLAEQDKPKMVYDMVDEQLDVTARAFMALTVGCARCHDHKFDPLPTRDYYSMASIFASTRSLSKVQSLVSELLFVPLVPKKIADRYREHQARIKAKLEEIQDLLDTEGARRATTLRPLLSKYMLASWQYENRPGSLSNLALENWARRENLEPGILEHWIQYLKPTDEVLPHLEPWLRCVKTSANTLTSQDVTEQTLPAPPPSLVEVALSLQKESETIAAEWQETLAQWKRKAEEAIKVQMTPPEKPVFEKGKHRFFADVFLEKGPFALPEKDPEQVFSQEARAKITSLRTEHEALKKGLPPEPPMACAVEEGPSVQQRVFIRGNVANPGEEVPKQFLQIIAGEHQVPITRGSGRLELADWLINPNHPLTGRVMANRLWQWHFGEGLVRTPNNFGKLGESPTHPELLDYLTRQFVKKSWSIKAMHRLILLSSTYQMSSTISKEAFETDPANRLLSHMSRRRLEVEEIHDGMLALGGELDLTMGGTLQTGFGTDEENDNSRLSIAPETTRRRTCYLPLRRSNLPSLLNLFDFGDATTPTESRSRTNVASQALYMMNSEFVADRAQLVASRIVSDSESDDRERVVAAYLYILGRKPKDSEVEEVLSYRDTLEKRMVGSAKSPEGSLSPDLKAWQSLCRVLLSSNEFIYVD
jgi:Protein of unknown function (DUF1553)/Protein of unknown function (DUF1549)/Planctomycete cytochrome C